jgi:predicted transcriptional regulator
MLILREYVLSFKIERHNGHNNSYRWLRRFCKTMEMFEVLTAQRLRLIEATRIKPYSITALAQKLKRDPRSVRRDVAKLEQYGVIRTREEINPGHGRVKIVEASSGKFILQVTF